MGEKDILEKGLLEHNDVFMDVIKVLLGIDKESYDGLEGLNPHGIYKDNLDKIRKQERDVFKAIKMNNVKLVALGVENQSSVDYRMPFRILRYDGVAYEDQLYEEEKGIYPVITIVLYFGKRHWTGPKKISDKVDVPEVLKPYFNDYKVNLFEVAYLTDEQVTKDIVK